MVSQRAQSKVKSNEIIHSNVGLQESVFIHYSLVFKKEEKLDVSTVALSAERDPLRLYLS